MSRAATTTAAAAICVLLFAAMAAPAAIINSAQTGNWEDPNTWVGLTVPALATDDAFILNGHTVQMDTLDGAGNGDETTLGTITVNTGGRLQSWMGDMICSALTFDGGTVVSNQRTLELKAGTSLVITANGGEWGTTKAQNSKHAWLITPVMTGTGDLTNYVGAAGQVHEVRIPDLTGYTGTFIMDDLPQKLSTTETSSAHLKFTNDIAEADASFGLELVSGTYDWPEATGGTAATDDGTFYGGYDMRDGNREIWVTSLTVGGFAVPARPGAAYTYAELAAMNGGDVANYLKSDGTDGTLGVVPEPATMGLLAFGALGVLSRRRRRRQGV